MGDHARAAAQPQGLRCGLSDPIYWRGFRMVATRSAQNDAGRKIHLQEKAPDSGTLCGLLRMEIVDLNASTGWPDCNDCIKKATEPPQPNTSGYTAA